MQEPSPGVKQGTDGISHLYNTNKAKRREGTETVGIFGGVKMKQLSFDYFYFLSEMKREGNICELRKGGGIRHLRREEKV